MLAPWLAHQDTPLLVACAAKTHTPSPPFPMGNAQFAALVPLTGTHEGKIAA